MRLVRRLATLLRPRRDRELAEEMRFHQDQQQADGLSSIEAQRAFGNDLLLRERSRDAWGWLWLAQFARDLRHTARLLRRSPGFATVAILSLAVGIGVNVAVFSLVDAVALRPLAATNPSQLIRLDWTSHQWDTPSSWGTNYTDAQGRNINTYFSYPLFDQWRRSNHTLSGILAFQPLSHIDVSSEGRAEAAQGTLVSGSYHAVLGLEPALGRAITEADLAPGAPPVAMLSYVYWRQRFGGDANVIGSVIKVNNLPMVVVGVEPQAFRGLEVGRVPDVYLPLNLVQGHLMQGWAHPPQLSDAKYWFVQVLGRLQPGVTMARARADLGVTFQQSVAAMPPDPANQGDKPVLLAFPAANGVNNTGQEMALPLEILFTLTGLVMLIVCINLANLLLARATARQGEMAIRVAIGAGRLALVRQLLTESVGLALVGAAVSLPVAIAAARGMVAAFIPPDITLHPRLDALAIALALALALVAALIMGLIPALRATRRSQPALRAAGARHRLGEILLVAQVALCLLVLSVAGLFLRTLQNLQNAPTGLDARNLTLFQLDAPLEGYSGPRLDAFYRQVLDRLRQLPGVTAVSATDIVPGGESSSSTHDISITPDAPAAKNPRTRLAKVATGFFATYRIHLLAGRDFTSADDAAAPLVAIVNRALATRFTGLPIGQKLFWQSDKTPPKVLQIVGVAANSAYNGVRDASTPVLYLPIAQQPAATLDFVTRSTLPSSTLIAGLRRTVGAVDPQVPVYGVQTQVEAMAASYDSQGMLAALSSILGALALLLAAIGLYGLLAYNVARRTREIGVRIALGASRNNVLGLVLRQSLTLVMVGAAIGVPLAWFANRAIKDLLYGVSPSDPWTLAVAILFLLAVALAAAWFPARHAARVDPMAALRCE